MIKKGLELVEQKDLHRADQVITNIVKSPTLSEKQR